MTTTSMSTRRMATLGVVAVSLVLGFGAIRAAAAWTAAAAPLTMGPTSVVSLQARLADETARSATLQDDLAGLSSHARELTTALEAAQARIAADGAQATTLARDLAKAKAKLATLERSIRRAAQASASKAPAPAAAPASSGGSHGGDDGGEEPDD